jgi:hypothetical protein
MKYAVLVSALAVVLAIGASANAQLSLTFDSDVQGFQDNVQWVSGVAGWPGGGVIQQSLDVGGWTMGDPLHGPAKQYNWNEGQQEIQQIVAAGNGWLHFDVLMDGTSFPNNVGTWFQVNMAGNSEHGWTQLSDILAGQPNAGWRNAGDTNLYTWHADVDFTWLNWTAGATWYQLYFGTNSDADKPVKFYLDNVIITPEPTAGLLLLSGLLLARRRRS